ncbi:hypothetical protein HFP89_07415 [Wenzhouxiangella sp. XN79A]|uniref:hypothetical protein n=1 Tax=Wenzhouxiangella sp. XN79A TaxID=2724193 RepID=UPI00144A7E24|nr:hypothetical protein [Wenzhouxiangella sp. XN79A]NKI34990.1 hypothetical protein [Wenzhouxiangella sp. XN79A]
MTLRPVRFLPIFLLAAVLTGCADDDSGDAPPEGAGVLEPQRQAIERARGVEDDLAEAVERQRERIEDDEG